MYEWGNVLVSPYFHRVIITHCIQYVDVNIEYWYQYEAFGFINRKPQTVAKSRGRTQTRKPNIHRKPKYFFCVFLLFPNLIECTYTPRKSKTDKLAIDDSMENLSSEKESNVSLLSTDLTA